jgi:hypothetical protein
MKKTIRLSAAGVAMFAALGLSTAAHADTEPADATAEVLDALILTNTAGLDFGSMVITGAGTVSLDGDNLIDCSNANITCSGTTTAATFDVTGTASKAVTIILPSTDVNLRHPSYDPLVSTGEHTIVLNGFTSNENGATGPEVVLDAAGDGTFGVGGTINLDGSEVPGVFTGTFNVTVEYS